jgi:predicted transcriptional regulator
MSPSPDRRRTPERTFDIKQLWQRNHEILRLAFLGWKNKDIADHLGVTAVTVGNTVNSTLGKDKLNLMTGSRDADTLEVMDEIQKMVPKALKVYDSILEEDSPAALSLKKNTADTVLKDILGNVAPKKVEGKFMHAHLGEETIDRIKERGRAAAAQAGILAEGAGE